MDKQENNTKGVKAARGTAVGAAVGVPLGVASAPTAVTQTGAPPAGGKPAAVQPPVSPPVQPPAQPPSGRASVPAPLTGKSAAAQIIDSRVKQAQKAGEGEDKNPGELSHVSLTYDRIAITGGRGYIGTLVVEEIKKLLGNQVYILRIDTQNPLSSQSPSELKNSPLIDVDILETKKLAEAFEKHQIQSVIHLASGNAMSYKQMVLEHAYYIDVEGTKSVLEACVKAGVKHITVNSSTGVYGHYEDMPVQITEDARLRGHPLVNETNNKLMVEYIMEKARQHYPQLRQTIFRISTLLTRQIKHPIIKLFRQPTLVGLREYETYYCFIWEHDLANCLILAALEGRYGIYNLSADGVISLTDVSKISGKDIKYVSRKNLKMTMMLDTMLNGGGMPPGIIDYLYNRPVVDNTALKEKFGYYPAMAAYQSLNQWLTFS